MTGGRRNPTRRLASVAAAAAVISALILLPTPALAGCHFFTFAPASYEVNEGAGKVTITVRRDDEFAPSSVRVRTVNGTAAAGQDYTAVDTRIDFPTGVQRTFDVQILDDNLVEGNEQFTAELSDGQGCAVNPNFAYGNPARVTIVDNDQAAAPPPPQEVSPPPPAATEPEPSPTESPAPAETLPIDSTPGEGPEIEDDGEATGTVDVAADEEDGGGSAVPIIVAIALVVAAGAGGGLWWLRRRQSAV